MSAQTYPISVISKLLLISDRRVQQLVKEGHLPKGERGRYELVACVQAYIRYLRDRAVTGDDAGGDLDDKRRLAKARADIAEFEAKRLAGDLVEVGDVRIGIEQLTSLVRVRCLAIAPKAAPLVALEAEVDRCHEIIGVFVDEALAELAATEVVARLPVGAGVQASPGGNGATSEADDLGMG